MIAIVDYGFGNLRSVVQAIQYVGEKNVVLAQTAQDIEQADKIIFPGQGAMPDCLKELEKRHLKTALLHALKQKPFLGICLGLQLLFEQSEEGNSPGLGILKGKVWRFQPEQNPKKLLKIPHMGWNNVKQTQTHFLWQNIAPNARFYFVHSFYAQAQNTDHILGTTHYGVDFTSAVVFQNGVAVQFHPEKSAEDGLQFLKNFTLWQP